MPTSYTYIKDLDCCGGGEVMIQRTILRELDDDIPSGLIRYSRASTEAVGEYKALSRRNGNTRQYDINITTKAGLVRTGSTLGQAAQAVGSILMPGNISRVRSPIRSAGWRAITPGLPGGGRGIRRRNRAARCPEGYQYGGRFTDNRLSTCGAKLFDIPSILGLAISDLQRLARGQVGIQGRVIKPGPGGEDLVRSRAPQIPRVGNENRQRRIEQTGKIIEAMGKPNIDATRMVRQDGFALEPVVSAAVLRTIPDNRDMEGATYLMSLKATADLGGEELGLLSNTGVRNVTYVMPDGSTLSVEKVRNLTVGERRKLGRTVNAAIKTNNSKDPAARLKFLSEETGDGISYTENLVTKDRSISAILKAGRKPGTPERAPAPGKKIGNVDDAVAHINQGRPLSGIKPSILQEALKRANVFKRRSGGILETSGGGEHVIQSASNDFEHINMSVNSEIQKHLGMSAPGIAFVGKGGKRRRYIADTPGGTVRGATVNRNRVFADHSPADVARMLMADLITGTDDRQPSGVTSVGETLVPTVIPSGLTDLDEIKITRRGKERVAAMQPLAAAGMYSAYYRELREDQQRMFQRQILQLVERARAFNFTKFRDRLYADSELSEVEKTHLNIVKRIVESRVKRLVDSRDGIIKLLERAS